MRWWFNAAVIPSAVLFLGLPLPSQVLQLSSPSGSPGERVSIQIALQSPRDRQPSALQWEYTIPLARLSPLEEATPGPAAHAADKSLGCTVKRKTDASYTSVCILYGGIKPINNGVVAILTLKIAADAQPGSFRIRLDQGLAILKELQRIPIDPAETIVTIRKK